MTRSEIPEADSGKSSPYTAKFHPVPATSASEPRIREPPESTAPPVPIRPVPAPPIPLALPQLLDAEKKEKQARLLEEEVLAPVTEENTPDLEEVASVPSMPSPTTEWPGRLQVADVGASKPSTRQSTSFAEAAAQDEHYSKPRPSVVKTTIRDLLTATKRKVSGKSAKSKDRDGEPLVQESEVRQSVDDLKEMDSKAAGGRLPSLQATPDEVAKIASTDGKCLPVCAKHRSDKSSDSGTASSMTVESFDQKFETPAEQPSTSPVKMTTATPLRGRLREASPGGRPYTIDQKFKLSPARSGSRGSRGSLTFNIKARVSPGRGMGKDDTELFVTANIESDESDEGH